MDGVETPPIILGDGAFPIKSRIMKPHVDTVLTPEKAYFNYRLSRARMIVEGAFSKLKGRFRVLFHKCESKQETENYGSCLCCIAQFMHDKEDIPRKFDLSYDHVTNKRRDRAELRDMLNLTNSRLKNYDTGRGEGIKVREAITKAFWDEKK